MQKDKSSAISFSPKFPRQTQFAAPGTTSIGIIIKGHQLTGLSRVLGNMCFRLQALNGTDQQQFIMAA